MSTNEAIVSIRNVTKTFPRGGVTALQHSTTIPSGSGLNRAREFAMSADLTCWRCGKTLPIGSGRSRCPYCKALQPTAGATPASEATDYPETAPPAQRPMSTGWQRVHAGIGWERLSVLASMAIIALSCCGPSYVAAVGELPAANPSDVQSGEPSSAPLAGLLFLGAAAVVQAIGLRGRAGCVREPEKQDLNLLALAAALGPAAVILAEVLVAGAMLLHQADGVLIGLAVGGLAVLAGGLFFVLFLYQLAVRLNHAGLQRGALIYLGAVALGLIVAIALAIAVAASLGAATAGAGKEISTEQRQLFLQTVSGLSLALLAACLLQHLLYVLLLNSARTTIAGSAGR